MNDAQNLIKLLMQALDCKRENYPPLLDSDVLDMKIGAAKRAYLRFVDAGGMEQTP